MLRRSALPFVHRGEFRDVPYLDRTGRSQDCHWRWLTPSSKLAPAIAREAPERASDFARRIDSAMVAELVARLPRMPPHVFDCGSNAFVNIAADGARMAVRRADERSVIRRITRTDLGFTRDQHFSMRESAEADLRAQYAALLRPTALGERSRCRSARNRRRRRAGGSRAPLRPHRQSSRRNSGRPGSDPFPISHTLGRSAALRPA